MATPLMVTGWPAPLHSTTSPGRPISRLMRYPPPGVLLCSSFSKTLAPGYRVGWIAPGRHLEEVLHRKLVSNIASASPGQLAVAEFLADGGYSRHLRAIRRAYAAKLGRMAEDIARSFPAGTRVTRPAGGFTLWLELPAGVDALAVHQQALAYGISTAPGPIFSAKREYGNANEWRRIFEANQDTIKNPDKIFPGQVLKIPAIED